MCFRDVSAINEGQRYLGRALQCRHAQTVKHPAKELNFLIETKHPATASFEASSTPAAMAVGVAIVFISTFISAKPLSLAVRAALITRGAQGHSAARSCAARLQWTREVGAASMVPPLALNHVEQRLKEIALSSARAREDIDRLFDAATAPVAAPETEDFESDAAYGQPQPKTPRIESST